MPGGEFPGTCHIRQDDTLPDGNLISLRSRRCCDHENTPTTETTRRTDRLDRNTASEARVLDKRGGIGAWMEKMEIPGCCVGMMELFTGGIRAGQRYHGVDTVGSRTRSAGLLRWEAAAPALRQRPRVTHAGPTTGASNPESSSLENSITQQPTCPVLRLHQPHTQSCTAIPFCAYCTPSTNGNEAIQTDQRRAHPNSHGTHHRRRLGRDRR